MRDPILRTFDLLPGEIAVDNFAGGGGTSTGVEQALGRPCDIAINHDPIAITMHRANHPNTRHYVEDVWAVDPQEVASGRPVGLAWFSPDCRHFSSAKGAAPVSDSVRGLAWVVVRWAREAKPRIIIVENVQEFQTWGPLDEDCMPIKSRAGETFREWVAALVECGYSVEFQTLVAADFGAPTTRKRLFLVARRDGRGVVWPEPTHGEKRAEPWRTAAEVIDWSLPTPSIFARKRPLAEATLRRIAAGVRRYVVEARTPFLIRTDMQSGNRLRGVASVDEPLRTITSSGGLALVSPFVPLLTKHYGGVVGHELTRPVGTVTATDHHALTAAFLTKFYGTSIGASCDRPLPTVTGGGQHLAEVKAFLIKYYGASGRAQAAPLGDPLHTITSHARFGLVVIAGETYQITDIGMRMLAPHELFGAQGFPPDYEIRPSYYGRPISKTDQIRLAGNSVCPPVARAIVAANVRSC